MGRYWVLGVFLHLSLCILESQCYTQNSLLDDDVVSVTIKEDLSSPSSPPNLPGLNIKEPASVPKELKMSQSTATSFSGGPYTTQNDDTVKVSVPIQVKEIIQNTSTMATTNFSSVSDTSRDLNSQTNLPMVSTHDLDANTTSYSTMDSSSKSKQHVTAIKSNITNTDIVQPSPTATIKLSRDSTRKEAFTTANGNEIWEPTTNVPPKPISYQAISKLWFIVVLIILLVLLSIVMLIIVMRKKRRSRSLNVSSRSRKGGKQDVWAGQAPEMAEGKPLREGAGQVNGEAMPLIEVKSEEELITFGNGEKKGDSVVEIEDLEEGDKQDLENSVTQEEQRPAVEGGPAETPDGEVGAKEEQFPLPSPGQELMGNGDKTI